MQLIRAAPPAAGLRLAIIIAVSSILAAACTETSDPLVAERQANRRNAEKAVLALKDNLENAGTTGDRTKELAETLAKLQRDFAGLFPPGSSRGSRALDVVWSDPGAFARASDMAISAADRLAGIAREGNARAALDALYDYGKTCGACHDRFKTPDQSRSP